MRRLRSRLWNFRGGGVPPSDEVAYSIASYNNENGELEGYVRFKSSKRHRTVVRQGGGGCWTMAEGRSDWNNSSEHLRGDRVLAFRTGVMRRPPKAWRDGRMALLRVLELANLWALRACAGCRTESAPYSCRSYDRLANFLSSEGWQESLSRAELMALLEVVRPTLSSEQLAGVLEVCKCCVEAAAILERVIIVGGGGGGGGGGVV